MLRAYIFQSHFNTGTEILTNTSFNCKFLDKLSASKNSLYKIEKSILYSGWGYAKQIIYSQIDWVTKNSHKHSKTLSYSQIVTDLVINLKLSRDRVIHIISELRRDGFIVGKGQLISTTKKHVPQKAFPERIRSQFICVQKAILRLDDGLNLPQKIMLSAIYTLSKQKMSTSYAYLKKIFGYTDNHAYKNLAELKKRGYVCEIFDEQGKKSWMINGMECTAYITQRKYTDPGHHSKITSTIPENHLVGGVISHTSTEGNSKITGAPFQNNRPIHNIKITEEKNNYSRASLPGCQSSFTSKKREIHACLKDLDMPERSKRQLSGLELDVVQEAVKYCTSPGFEVLTTLGKAIWWYAKNPEKMKQNMTTVTPQNEHQSEYAKQDRLYERRNKAQKVYNHMLSQKSFRIGQKSDYLDSWYNPSHNVFIGAPAIDGNVPRYISLEDPDLYVKLRAEWERNGLSDIEILDVFKNV